MGAVKIMDVLTAGGCGPMRLSNEEVWQWQQRWREVYAKELHAETGTWVHNEFDWHVFSFGKHRAKSGDAAWAEYRRLGACSFLVLSASTRDTFGFSCNGKPPERLKAGIDVLVAPPSMEWTMSFNHEDYGPYFAVP